MDIKLSKFVIKVKQSECRTALYNTRTGSLISIDNSVLGYLESGNMPLTIKEEFKNRGYIVDKGSNEAIDYIEKVKEYRGNNKTLSVTIAPSYACNFDCKYCFVKKDSCVMSPKIQSSIVNYLIKTFELVGYEKLKIQWFGGEPLLYLDIIENIMCKLVQAIGSDNIESTVVTNGYLLNDAIYKKIMDLGISVIQVTIDSDEKTHNTYRKLKNGQPTYKTIIKNIRELLSKSDHFILNIRINYFEQNKLNIESTINDISAVAEKENVYIQLKPILPFEEISCDGCVKYSEAEMMKIELEQKICKSTDAVIQLPSPRFRWCSAGTESALNIGPHGEFYFCKSQFGHLHKAMGVIENGNILFNSNYKRYKNLNDLTQKCYSCSFLPICMGGCKIMREKHVDRCYWNQETIEKMVLTKLKCRKVLTDI